MIDPELARIRARLVDRARSRAVMTELVLIAVQTFLILSAATLACARVFGVWH